MLIEYKLTKIITLKKILTKMRNNKKTNININKSKIIEN